MLEYLISLKIYVPQITIFIGLFAVIYSAHKNSTSKFDVFDYLIDPATGKASITKTLQVLAGLTATWIVAKQSIAGLLTTEMFAIYLGAMGISEAWSKFVGAKFSRQDSHNTEQ